MTSSCPVLSSSRYERVIANGCTSFVQGAAITYNCLLPAGEDGKLALMFCVGPRSHPRSGNGRVAERIFSYEKEGFFGVIKPPHAHSVAPRQRRVAARKSGVVLTNSMRRAVAETVTTRKIGSKRKPRSPAEAKEPQRNPKIKQQMPGTLRAFLLF